MILSLHSQTRKLFTFSYNYYLFSRSQNFFEINPIYPDMSQKDFDLYNTNRKKIPALQAYQKVYKRHQSIKKKIKDNFFLQTQRKMKKNTKQRVDQQTGFLITQNPELNQFIQDYKKNKQVGSNVKKQFNQILEKLVKRFNMKSQTQLIRILRISLANAKKGSFKQKLRSQLIQQAVLSNVTDFKNIRSSLQVSDQLKIDQKQLDQAAFQQALKEIDQKIFKAEKQLRYQKDGARKSLKKFDPDYGWEQIQNEQFNPEFSMVTNRGSIGNFQAPMYHNAGQVQDRSIERRIRRLYFLQRLRYVNNQAADQKTIEKIHKQLPINIKGADKIINNLARMYKQAQLEVVPDINQIYEEIDVVLNKIYIRSANKKDGELKNIQGRQIVEEMMFKKQDLVWNNLDVDQVFTPQVILPQEISEKNIEVITPSAQTQLSLNRLPFNLYRHNELQVFGVFNKYKKFILKNFLNNQTVDPTTQFKFFNITSAKRILGKADVLAQKQQRYQGSATRKSAFATVVIYPGTGIVTVNGGTLRDYFPDPIQRAQALKPIVFVQLAGQYDIQIQVHGSGTIAQSNCCAFALARALIKMNKDFYDSMQKIGFHKGDPRKMQKKRIGLYSARVRPPYVRR